MHIDCGDPGSIACGGGAAPGSLVCIEPSLPRQSDRPDARQPRVGPRAEGAPPTHHHSVCSLPRPLVGCPGATQGPGAVAGRSPPARRSCGAYSATPYTLQRRTRSGLAAAARAMWTLAAKAWALCPGWTYQELPTRGVRQRGGAGAGAAVGRRGGRAHLEEAAVLIRCAGRSPSARCSSSHVPAGQEGSVSCSSRQRGRTQCEHKRERGVVGARAAARWCGRPGRKPQAACGRQEQAPRQGGACTCTLWLPWTAGSPLLPGRACSGTRGLPSRGGSSAAGSSRCHLHSLSGPCGCQWSPSYCASGCCKH